MAIYRSKILDEASGISKPKPPFRDIFRASGISKPKPPQSFNFGRTLPDVIEGGQLFRGAGGGPANPQIPFLRDVQRAVGGIGARVLPATGLGAGLDLRRPREPGISADDAFAARFGVQTPEADERFAARYGAEEPAYRRLFRDIEYEGEPAPSGRLGQFGGERIQDFVRRMGDITGQPVTGATRPDLMAPEVYEGTGFGPGPGPFERPLYEDELGFGTDAQPNISAYMSALTGRLRRNPPEFHFGTGRARDDWGGSLGGSPFGAGLPEYEATYSAQRNLPRLGGLLGDIFEARPPETPDIDLQAPQSFNFGRTLPDVIEGGQLFRGAGGGPANPQIPFLRDVQRAVGGIGARVLPATGLGAGLDLLDTLGIGGLPSSAGVGRLVSEALIPTTPLELGAMGLPVVGQFGRGAAAGLGLGGAARRAGLTALEQLLPTPDLNVPLPRLPSGLPRTFLTEAPSGARTVERLGDPVTAGGRRIAGGADVPPPAVAHETDETLAGNIRLSKFPEDLRSTIKDWADANPETVQAARRGVRTDAEVLEDARALAEEAGGDFAKLQRRWKPGDAWNAEEVTAIRGTLRAKTEEVMRLAAIARADNSAVNHASLLLAIEDQARVQQQVHGVTAEAGRALRSFRQEVFDATTTNDTRKLEELLRRVAGDQRGKMDALADRVAALDLDNPAEVNTFLQQVMKHGPNAPRTRPGRVWAEGMDWLHELWINSILSGPATHAVNAISNSAFAMMQPLERGVAAVVDIPLSGIQGRPRARFFQEVPASTFGLIEGIPEGVRGALRTMRDGFTPAQASKWEFKRQSIPGIPGRIIRLPGTALEAADSFFYAINYRASLNANVARQVKQEGLTGARAFERAAELKLDPPHSLMKDAIEQAEYRLFRQEPGEFTQAAMNLRRIPGLKYVVPFLRTPGNLMGAGFERSPLGLMPLNRKLWEGITQKSPMASDQLARILMGSSIMAGLGAMVAKGTIDVTAGAPTNAAERDRFFREGKQPHSIKVAGVWIAYNRLEPYNTPISLLAGVVEAVRQNDDASALQIASQAAASIGQNVLDQSYFSNLGNLMDALEDPARYGEYLAVRTATGFVPFSSLLRQAAQTMDPTFRRPEGLAEAVKVNIPGLTGQVPPRLTAFGEEATRQSPAAFPIRFSPDKQSAVDAELERLGVEVGFTGKSIATYPLNREQQSLFQRAAGQATYQAMNALLESEAYNRLNDADKEKLLRKAIDFARDQVRDPARELMKAEKFGALTPEEQDILITSLLQVAAENPARFLELVGR